MGRRKTGILILLLLAFSISGCSSRTNEETVQTNDIPGQQEGVKRQDTPEQQEISGQREAEEQQETSDNSSDSEKMALGEVMERILFSQGLQGALDYEAAFNNEKKAVGLSEDAIVLLCTSESGKYEAYGFISPEYGTAGILLNNIIDGGDNWNYVEEPRSYGSMRPALEETGEYEVLFTFTQKNIDTAGSKDSMNDTRKIYFNTYDTGTMSIKK